MGRVCSFAPTRARDVRANLPQPPPDKPIVRPCTPEAQAQGCLCRFESNLEAAFLAAERGHEDETIVVIYQDCPLHKIVTKPMDDALGEL